MADRSQNQNNAAPADINKMTKVQKLASLLVLLGPESATQILKNLEKII